MGDVDAEYIDAVVLARQIRRACAAGPGAATALALSLNTTPPIMCGSMRASLEDRVRAIASTRGVSQRTLDAATRRIQRLTRSGAVIPSAPRASGGGCGCKRG